MNDHTITVGVDDEKLNLDSIVSALYEAGYVVKERTKVE